MLCCVKPGDWTPDKEPLYRDATHPREDIYRRGQLPHGHGIHMSAAASIENVNIEHFTGNGINIVATGKAVETAGNANGFQVQNCTIGQCAGHGVYVYGNDVQGGLVQRTMAIINKGWGFFDESAEGNTYIVCLGEGILGHYKRKQGETNSNRDYKTMGATANSESAPGALNASCFVGCYTEAATNEVVQPSMVLGGHLAQDSVNTSADAAAFLLSGGHKSGVAYRAPFVHQNKKGPMATWVEVGGNDRDMVALRWGTPPGSPLLDYTQIIYDETKHWWMVRNNGTSDNDSLGLATTMLDLRAFAPHLPNGIFYGRANDLTLHTSGREEPTSGRWKVGDIVWNKDPSKAFIGWVCTVEGTAADGPVFKTFGAISP
jgi:hypothetical protein